MDTVDERLKLLERALLRSRRAHQLLVMAAVAVACAAGAQKNTQNPSKPSNQPAAGLGRQPGTDRVDTLQSNRFVLVDRLGRSRVTMEVTDNGPAVSMFDQEGQKRLELGQTADAWGVRLLESNEPVVSLQIPSPGDPAHLEIRSAQGSARVKSDGLSIHDSAHHGRVYLSLLNGNFPVLGLTQDGQHGPPSIELTANDSTRSLKIHDPDGKPLFSVIADDSGHTCLGMRHPDHERLLQITAGPKDFDGPMLALMAATGPSGAGGLLPRLRLGLDRDGQPLVRILDPAGRTRFAAPSP